jgi:predicted methyltransferase
MLWRAIGRDEMLRVYGMLADRMGSDLTAGQTWMVTRVADQGPRSVAAMAEASHTPVETVQQVAAQLQAKGLVTVSEGTVTITDDGHTVARTVQETAYAALRRLVDEWPGAQQADVNDLVDEIVARLTHDDRPLAPIHA